MPTPVLRHIPSVSELLEAPVLKGLVERVSHNAVVAQVRGVLDEVRQELQTSASERSLPQVADLAERIARRVLQGEQPALRGVINATGILLHTGLGRAPLADAALAAIHEAAHDYASVEVNLTSGLRSHRSAAVEGLLRELTGAEAAAVANNNAGATMLTLAALAAGREVIVSRGQLVEIGGSYRLPDVMTTSGAVLREVGTTNKTRLSDYRDAINERTAALLVVHPSNYKVVGFSETPELGEVVRLGRERNVPVIHDVGSGALIDFAKYGFQDEPLVPASVVAGADLVLFSGDKLLGGPQCGIAVGRKALVDKLTAHPLMRALRVDKLTLAALAATLRLYRDPATLERTLPLMALLATSADNLKNRAERLAPQMSAAKAVARAEAIPEQSYLGGGSLPTQQLATWCVALTPADRSVDRLAAQLRQAAPAVVGRVKADRLLLDLRSVFPRQDISLVETVEAVSG